MLSIMSSCGFILYSSNPLRGHLIPNHDDTREHADNCCENVRESVVMATTVAPHASQIEISSGKY